MAIKPEAISLVLWMLLLPTSSLAAGITWTGGGNLSPLAAATCSTTPINIGDTKSGTLADTDCISPSADGGRFADQYTFSGTAGQEVAITALSEAFTPYIFLVRQSDNTVLNSAVASGAVVRIPDGGFFTLPTTGTYIIEVTSAAANAAGDYTVTLGDPSTPYAVAGTVKSGAVIFVRMKMKFSSSTRVMSASARPMLRALPCWSAGSLPERIEMKMMLSTPRTISRTVSVTRLSHASGFVSQANMAAEKSGRALRVK